MKKRTLLHFAVGFAATICFMAAGLSFNMWQNSNVNTSAHPQSESVHLQRQPVGIFNFGDNNDHQILLDLANSPMQDYTLTTVSLDDPLTTRPIAVCTHTGVPVVSPPASVAASKTQPAAPSLWERITAWLTTPARDNYFVALWSPNDDADAYVLVSGDGPTAPVVCSSPADEGV